MYEKKAVLVVTNTFENGLVYELCIPLKWDCQKKTEKIGPINEILKLTGVIFM